MKKIFDAKIWSKYLQKIGRHPIFIKSSIIAGVVLVFIAGAIFVFNLTYSQRIFPKTYIGGLSLGGKTLAEAKNILTDGIRQTGNKEINLTFEDKSWKINSSDIDLVYEAQKSAELAWAVGRQGGFSKIIKEQLRAVFIANKYPVVFEFNQVKLNDFILNLSKEIDIPEKDASIVIENLEPRVEPEKIGRRLNLAENSQIILKLFGELSPQSNHYLVVNDAQPKITQANAQNAYQETLKILEEKLVLRAGKKDFTLKPENMADWLDFVGQHPTDQTQTDPSGLGPAETETLPEWVLTTQLRQEKVRQYVEELANQINQEARDAKFTMSGGRAKAFQTSQTGYELDQEQAIKVITEAILSHQTEVDLPVKVTEPEVTASSAAEMGIKEIVGQGTTHFYNSPQNRRHNIQVGAKALHGIIIKPGEEFSALHYISPVNAGSGYLPELVIKENETIPEYGGGLCQVSTTLFRAALNTGLKITDRTNHSYRVSYYEPPIGMDATIYEPRPDFKFINNYEHPILLQASVDDGASAITFTFYGTKDERKVEISDPVGYDYTGAGNDIYVESPDLAPGEIKQVERAHGGAKAYFYYKVTRDGEVLDKQTFGSEYANWPARYLYGPGTEVPSPPAE